MLDKLDPLVTVIVPTYNVESFIGDCLDSLVNQTYSNLEVIVIDDDSTDGTVEICRRYQNIFSNIQILINDHNRGVSASRNRGIKYARGEYLSFVDGDDFLAPNFIKSLIDKAIEDSSDVVVTGFTFYYPDRIEPHSGSGSSIFPGRDLYAVANSIMGSETFSISGGMSWNKLFKKELFDYFIFPEDLWACEDEFLLSQLSTKVRFCSFLSGSGYYYRRREGQASEGRGFWLGLLNSRLKFFNYFKSNPDIFCTERKYYEIAIRIAVASALVHNIQMLMDQMDRNHYAKLKRTIREINLNELLNCPELKTYLGRTCLIYIRVFYNFRKFPIFTLKAMRKIKRFIRF